MFVMACTCWARVLEFEDEVNDVRRYAHKSWHNCANLKVATDCVCDGVHLLGKIECWNLRMR